MNTSAVITLALALAFLPSQGLRSFGAGGVGWCWNAGGRSYLKTRLLAQPDAPLQLRLSANERFVFATNVSDLEIASARLGAFDPKSSRVVADGDWFEVALKPGMSLFDVGTEIDQVLAGRRTRVQACVVEVQFADGSGRRLANSGWTTAEARPN